MHKHLTRLERVWVEPPIYFLTAYTEKRRNVLARESAVEILVDEWRAAHERHGWLVGRYVVMPDHVHFFCTPERDAKPLSDFMVLGSDGRVNESISSPATTAHHSSSPFWQAEFFDDVIRSDESYDEKWEYVRNNPARAGFITDADDWQFAGELTIFRR